MIGMTFPTLQNLMGASVFLIFATVCALLALLLKVYMPETRGKDTSEVAEKVADGFKSRPLESKFENLNAF
jgi:Sugar (and other) transporter